LLWQKGENIQPPSHEVINSASETSQPAKAYKEVSLLSSTALHMWHLQCF